MQQARTPRGEVQRVYKFPTDCGDFLGAVTRIQVPTEDYGLRYLLEEVNRELCCLHPLFLKPKTEVTAEDGVWQPIQLDGRLQDYTPPQYCSREATRMEGGEVGD